MALVKTYYLLRLSAFAVIAGFSLFCVGWSMGYKHQVVEAMKEGNTHKAAVALAGWSHADPNAKGDPVFLETLVALHMKQGNYEAAQYNIGRLVALKKGGKP